MSERAFLGLSLIILLLIAAGGVVTYKKTLSTYNPILERLQPTTCAGYNFSMTPDGVAVVYSIREVAYMNNTKIENVYLKQLVYLVQTNCTIGYTLIANKTWTPTAGESGWRQSIVIWGSNPLKLRYLIPSDLLSNLNNTTSIPGVKAEWKSVSNTVVIGEFNLSFFGIPAQYKIYETDAYDPITGIHTYRKLVAEKVSGGTGSIFAPPDRIVSESVIDEVYIKMGTSNSGDEFYGLNRLVENMILLGVAAGVLVSSPVIGIIYILTRL